MEYLTTILNALWSLCLDLVYMVLQLLLNTLTLLLSAITFLCPVFPNLTPPAWLISTAFGASSSILSYIAWIVPWGFALQMVVVMAACMMFVIMTSWTLRWLKVIR